MTKTVNEMWRERWEDKEVKRPPCYNHADFTNPLGKRWNQGCPAWSAGGNRWVHKVNYAGHNGETFEWSACNGCKHRQQEK